jgi:polyketide cyclase/dehydrase/lipid transport protein
MTRIKGEIVIGRPVDVVFDYVADQSNEPAYNPRMVRAEKITPGPVGQGTQFRSAVASRGPTAEMLIECTGYDRPSLLKSTTTMAQADISYTLTFEPAAGGTRMRWSGQVRPKGVLRLLGPLITWLGRRQEQRIWASLKNHLETPLPQSVSIFSKASRAWSSRPARASASTHQKEHIEKVASLPASPSGDASAL